MNAVVIKHVPVSELPALWRAKLSQAAFARISEVTVRLEEESADPQEDSLPLAITANPLFGMWRDRQDMADMDAYMRELRQPRLAPDGAPRNT